MISNRFAAVFLFVATLFFAGCGGAKKQVETVPTNPKPDWATQRPTDPNYYIGVGIASKMIHANDFQTIAKKNALEDMVGEINVRVNANSMLFSFEQNGRAGDEFKSFTKITALEQVENFEVVDSWENDQEFWILYRLSKAQYARDKQKRINTALEEAKAFAEIAVTNEKNGNILEAFDGYFKTLQIIEPYLSESLETDFKGEKVYFGALVQQSIEKLTQEVNIHAKSSAYDVFWGQRLSNGELAFSVSMRGKPVISFPVVFSFDHGRIRPKSIKTNASGVATTSLDKVRETDAIQIVKSKIDLVDLYNNRIEPPDEVITQILNGFAAPESKIILNVRAPRVYIQTHETLFGKKYASNLANIAKDQLLKADFNTVGSAREADFIFTVEARVTDGGKQFDMYRANIDGGVSVSKPGGETLFSESFENLSGVQLDLERAGSRAFDAASEEMNEVYIPRFKRFLLR